VSIDVTAKGSEQEKITLYVSAGNATRDRSKWKKIKEVPNANGGLYTLEVTGKEIADAIAPTAIAPGNSYTIYNQITCKDGRIFDFSNTSPTLSGNPNYNAALSWAAVVVCPFTGLGGTDIDYVVVQDDWVDWSPGDIVKVSDGPGANQVDISKVWPNPAYGNIVNKLVLNVDPATGAATSPAGVQWGNYGGIASTGSPTTGYVFSCTNTITMSIRILYNNADQGAFKLILRKK
jgi:hypothetical protein